MKVVIHIYVAMSWVFVETAKVLIIYQIPYPFMYINIRWLWLLQVLRKEKLNNYLRTKVTCNKM